MISKPRTDCNDLPIFARIVTLFDERMNFASNKGDKIEMLNKGGKFYACWPGMYKTDIFELSPADVARFLTE